MPTSEKIIIVTLALLVVLFAASTVYFYFERGGEENIAQNSEREAEEIVEEVSKLIVLPTDEKPTVATVSEPERLRDQPFFAKAQVGYKVLIYGKARKAILYDPVNKKIVDVAPINIGSGEVGGLE